MNQIFQVQTLSRGTILLIYNLMDPPQSGFLVYYGFAIPDILCIFTYLSLLVNWSEIYRVSHSRVSIMMRKEPHTSFLPHILLTLFFFLCCGVTFIIRILSTDEYLINSIGIAICLMYLIPVPATIVFFITQYQVYVTHFSEIQARRYSFQAGRLKNVAWTSLVVMVIFVLRSIIDAINIKYTIPASLENYEKMALELYYLLFETVPLALMLRLPYLLIGPDVININIKKSGLNSKGANAFNSASKAGSKSVDDEIQQEKKDKFSPLLPNDFRDIIWND